MIDRNDILVHDPSVKVVLEEELQEDGKSEPIDGVIAELHYDNKNEEETVVYTDILLNRKPTVRQAKLIIFTLFFMIGMIQWYQGAIVLDLQEKGAKYRDQAVFSFAVYPYLFKIIFAPLIDLFFIDKVGKCKTYIVISGLIISIALYLMAPFAESIIQPKSIYGLTGICFCMNLMVVFFQIAGEMWIVKIFDENEKSKGGIFIDVGSSLGGFITYNIFVPLSSLKWLNEHIFTKNPLTEPLLNHKIMMYFMASIIFVYSIMLLVFVGEKKMSNYGSPMTVSKLCRLLPRFFTNRSLRTFLFMIAINRVFGSMVYETMSLKLIDNGIKKAVLVNIDTLTYPLYLMGSCVMIKLIVKGKLLRFSMWMNLYSTILGLLRFATIGYLTSTHNIDTTTWYIILASVLQNLCFPFVFVMGFLNTITPEDIGSTFITFFMCWMNTTANIPATIGLRIVDSGWINYNLFVGICLFTQTACIIGSFRVATTLDNTDKQE